ncbi:MAG: hypothetical protein GX256_07725 [Fretibacterium sp.]|nr:hypothetical protein [Fretibacterium sp.]
MTQKKVMSLMLMISGFCLTGFIVYGLGYRLNFTHSVPVGLWKLNAGAILREEYVQVEVSEQAWYLLGVEREYYRPGARLLKKVVALEGDLVNYDNLEQIVTVNGKEIPLSEVASQDGMGRSMPLMTFPVRLKSGEAWLASENKRGYDSRYFGPVSLDLLQPAKLLLRM